MAGCQKASSAEAYNTLCRCLFSQPRCPSNVFSDPPLYYSIYIYTYVFMCHWSRCQATAGPRLWPSLATTSSLSTSTAALQAEPRGTTQVGPCPQTGFATIVTTASRKQIDHAKVSSSELILSKSLQSCT